jgi:hypothetical protein
LSFRSTRVTFTWFFLLVTKHGGKKNSHFCMA